MLWHRAYVRVLVGLHNAARLDVKAVRKAWNKASSKQPPFWANILEAFCDGHLPQMMEKAKTHDEQRLARYLNMQAVMYSGINTITIRACLAFLQQCPDCVCAADALCGTREIGTMQMTTASAFTLLSSALRRRLPDVYGFPASLAKRVTDAKPVQETVGEQGKEDEIEFHAQLVEDIKAETTSGHDTLEPSLDVLGNFIEETQFLQAIERLELEHRIWAVPTEQTIATYRPLCASPLGIVPGFVLERPGRIDQNLQRDHCQAPDERLDAEPLVDLEHAPFAQLGTGDDLVADRLGSCRPHLGRRNGRPRYGNRRETG